MGCYRSEHDLCALGRESTPVATGDIHTVAGKAGIEEERQPADLELRLAGIVLLESLDGDLKPPLPNIAPGSDHVRHDGDRDQPRGRHGAQAALSPLAVRMPNAMEAELWDPS